MQEHSVFDTGTSLSEIVDNTNNAGARQIS